MYDYDDALSYHKTRKENIINRKRKWRNIGQLVGRQLSLYIVMKHSKMQLNLLLTKSSTIMIYEKSDIFYGNKKHLRKDIGMRNLGRKYNLERKVALTYAAL